MRYRKKPIEIEAWPVYAVSSIAHRTPVLLNAFDAGIITPGYGDGLFVETLEGVVHAASSDMLIRGVAGEFYPCQRDVFEKTHERVDEGLSRQDLALKYGEEPPARTEEEELRSRFPRE